MRRGDPVAYGNVDSSISDAPGLLPMRKHSVVRVHRVPRNHNC
jgi:hypothetical protein